MALDLVRDVFSALGEFFHVFRYDGLVSCGGHGKS